MSQDDLTLDSNLDEETQEDESMDEGDIEDVFGEDDSKEDVIAKINKQSGKNFKSYEDVVASLKEADKNFANAGRQKQEEPIKAAVVENNEDVNELFYESVEDAGRVKADLEKIAKQLYGGSVLKAWRNEEWLRDKAKVLKKREEVQGRVGSPSTNSSVKTALTPEQKIAQKLAGNMPPGISSEKPQI